MRLIAYSTDSAHERCLAKYLLSGYLPDPGIACPIRATAKDRWTEVAESPQGDDGQGNIMMSCAATALRNEWGAVSSSQASQDALQGCCCILHGCLCLKVRNVSGILIGSSYIWYCRYSHYAMIV